MTNQKDLLQPCTFASFFFNLKANAFAFCEDIETRVIELLQAKQDVMFYSKNRLYKLLGIKSRIG